MLGPNARTPQGIKMVFILVWRGGNIMPFRRGGARNMPNLPSIASGFNIHYTMKDAGVIHFLAFLRAEFWVNIYSRILPLQYSFNLDPSFLLLFILG